MARFPPTVSFVAPSGTGKTTLIEGVIRILGERGLRIAVLKHDAHRLNLDHPGKDSYRFRQAGAWRSVVASDRQIGLFGTLHGHPTLGGLVSTFLSDADLVLTEGFRSSSVPAIRVHRAEAEDPTWSPGKVQVIAWASDTPLGLDVPLLPLDAPEAVADFIVQHLLQRPPAQRVTGLVAALEGIEAPAIEAARDALMDAGVNEIIIVQPSCHRPWAGARSIPDIRPGLGPLGALLTGLAASNTPEVLFISASKPPPPTDFLQGLLHWGHRQADVVVPMLGNRRMPLPGLYGHRCLGAIQTSLLSGEGRMDGWWSDIRVQGIDESIWRPTYPKGRL